MGIMPALLISTSTWPKLSTARWMSASTSARFVTSVASPMALPPLAEISLAPRSQYNFCSLFCERLRGAFPYAAAGSRDYYNFVGDI
jgi:hypothetical protein